MKISDCRVFRPFKTLPACRAFRHSEQFFMITAEIFARSLANLHCQEADRQLTWIFNLCDEARQRAHVIKYIVKNKLTISNGNRTKWSPIRSVIIRGDKQNQTTAKRESDLLITSMITD